MNHQLSTDVRLQGFAKETLGHNLVRSPSFPLGSVEAQKAADWTFKGTAPEHFGEEPEHYLGMLAQSQVWQDLDLPVLPNASEGTRPLYKLRLAYDATWYDECWVRVYHLEEGQAPDLLIERSLPGDPTRTLASWKALELYDIKARHRTGRIRVCFETPASPGSIFLYLKDVHLQLWLPPLSEESGVELVLDPDGSPIRQPVQAGRTLLLCHGAQHRLQVKAGAGDTWAGQPASLVWHDDGSQALTFGLFATPGFNGRDQDVEELYQPLPVGENAVWDIQASPERDIRSGDLAMGLGSYWVAPRYLLDAKVGDFRYEVTGMAWNGVVPIVSIGNSTRFTATVKSPYTDQRSLKGVEVVWSLNGTAYQTLLTDENGQVVLDYTPKLGEVGENNRVEIAATCKDGFQLDSKQQRSVPVFAGSPWWEELHITLDDRETQWSSPMFNLALFRGRAHTLTLKPKRADSYFIGRDLVLRWPEGTAAKLGITFPTAPVHMTERGATWIINGGKDASGEFVLELADTPSEEGVVLPIPLSLTGGQVCANLAVEADLKVDGSAPLAKVAFWHSREHRVSLVPKPDSPLKNLPSRVALKFTKGSLEEDAFVANPKFNEFTSLGDQGNVWSLKGAKGSGTFGLTVEVEGFSTPLALPACALLSQNLLDEVDVTVGGQAPAQTQIFRRGVPQVVSIVPKRGGGVEGLNPEVWLTFVNGTLTTDKVPASPEYGARRPVQGGVDWTLTGAHVSGTFGVEVHVAGYTFPVKLDALLASTRLADEADLKIDSAAPGAFPIFWRGRQHTLTLVPKAGGVLEQLNPDLSLHFIKQGALIERSLPSVPAYATPGKSKSWILEGSTTHSGMFGLEVRASGFGEGVSVAEAGLMSDDIADEAALQATYLAPAGRAYFVRAQPGNVSLVANPESPLRKLKVDTRLSFTVTERLVSADVPAQPVYGQVAALSEGVFSWTLTPGRKSGEFGLGVSVSGDYFSRTELSLSECVLISDDFNDEITFYMPYTYWWHEQKESFSIGQRESKLFRDGDVSIHFLGSDDGVAESHLGLFPGFGVVNPDLRWALESNTRSVRGLFRWELRIEIAGKVLAVATLPTGVLMSGEFNNEIDLYMDGEKFDSDSFTFHGGTQHTMEMVVKPESPILKLENPEVFCYFSEDYNVLDMTPGRNEKIPLGGGQVKWTYMAYSNNAGYEVVLYINKAGLMKKLEKNIKLIARN